MIVGKVCISEEDTVFEVEEDAHPEATEGGEGDEASELIVFRLHVSEPSARSPSLSPPLKDGWGVDAGPTVSEELLSLEGEQFVELLPTLVKDELQTVSAQATGDPADDTAPKVKVPYVLISEDVRQSYETTVTRADLDSCERWVVESRSGGFSQDSLMFDRHLLHNSKPLCLISSALLFTCFFIACVVCVYIA